MINQLLTRAIGAALLSVLPLDLLADGIEISDPYARVSRPAAPTGAAFMTITNTGEADDRLLSAASSAAHRVELHSHVDQGGGVMKMVELEEGILLPGGAQHLLKRGGDHVMLMGLVAPLEQGEEIEVVLSFEKAGDITVVFPVDNDRTPDHAGSASHGN